MLGVTAVRKACIIGHPVAHSRSPLIHNYWLKTLGLSGSYEREDVTVEQLPDFLRTLRSRGYVGGNVTVPHKEAVHRLADRRDAAAAAIGAVNTLWFEEDALVAGNTDAHGFATHLEISVPDWRSNARHAVVMGAGGAARAVVYALLETGLEIAIVNRSFDRANLLSAHFGGRPKVHGFAGLPGLMATADLLVNTTSLGMVGNPPLSIDLEGLNPTAIVYDIVYVPLETELLKAARRRGHRTVDGLGVLLHQAVPGFARWFGVTPKVTPELRAHIEADIRAKVRSA
jgi:shikimate dehydrogenase